MAAVEGPQIKTHSILEEYEVKWRQKLGCGVSGPVRPCKRRSDGHEFALKCLIDRPRARTEVKLHMKCSQHPHIVSIYDVYANEVQFPDEPFPRARLLLVMEYMEGGELFDRISKSKGFTEKKAAMFTKQIALAIQRCHHLNVAHRDLKPENLLLRNNSPDALVKLSDFGFAKVDDGSLTTPHFTPYYVAPQVLQAMKQQHKSRHQIIPRKQGPPVTYDKSCDMWSLGVIIYIMICGYPPFYSETPSKALSNKMKKKIIAGEYEFHREDWAEVSDLAKDLVQSLLTVDPAARLSVDEVLEHPWLAEAPENNLLSPAILGDREALEEMQQAHSQFLTSMRLPDKQVKLKPVLGANNPILKRRKQSQSSMTSSDVGIDCDVTDGDLSPRCTGVTGSADPELEEEPQSKHTSRDMLLQKLRDIVAHCILPTRGSTEEFHSCLEALIGCACQCGASDNKPALQVLHGAGWDGARLKAETDSRKLAQDLSKVIRDMTSSTKPE